MVTLVPFLLGCFCWFLIPIASMVFVRRKGQRLLAKIVASLWSSFMLFESVSAAGPNPKPLVLLTYFFWIIMAFFGHYVFDAMYYPTKHRRYSSG